MSLKNFEIMKHVGEGSYSSVYKVRRIKDHEIYALKKVKLLTLTEKERLNALNQIRLLASIDHPNIISYKDAFIDKQSSTLCLITEYADDGDLEQKINKIKTIGENFTEDDIWTAFTQIAKGLKALHANNIIHRDLKCANVFLFKDGTYKLGDMNVSKIITENLCFTQTGTPYYASPEIWKDRPYDFKSDVWSLGCIVYEMCALHPPFQAQSMENLYKKVVKGIYPKLQAVYSKNLKSIIRSMLQVNQNSRPSIQYLLSSPLVTYKTMENEEDLDNETIKLLQTIKMSNKIGDLRSMLPKAKYVSSGYKKKVSLRVVPSSENLKNNYNSVTEPKFSSERFLPLISQKRMSKMVKS